MFNILINCIIFKLYMMMKKRKEERKKKTNKIETFMFAFLELDKG